MLVAIDTAYADTTAADLRFALGLAPQPALRELVVPVGDGAVILRLLGASHQVVLDIAGGELSETVACLPQAMGSEPLPARFTAPRYRFAAEVRRLAPARFTVEVAALRDRAVGAGAAIADPAGVRGEYILAGEFPGASDALTVLAARQVAGGVRWWTAHAYPQTAELVLTRSTKRW